MAAAEYTLVIEQGTTLDKTFTIKNSDGTFKDLSTYTARLMVREDFSSAAPLLSLTSPSVAEQGIDLDSSGGVRVRATAATTAALSFHLVLWDLEIVDAGGRPTRVLMGQCLLSPEATK